MALAERDNFTGNVIRVLPAFLLTFECEVRSTGTGEVCCEDVFEDGDGDVNEIGGDKFDRVNGVGKNVRAEMR